MSSSELRSEASRGHIYDVVETWERLFGVKPSVKTMIKIMKVRELLKRGATLKEAVRNAGLGWKSFYKYAPLIYLNDPNLLIPIQKYFLKQYIHVMDFDNLT